MRNRNGIFWGLFLLVGAAILIVSQLHLISYNFNFWTIVASIFLVGILIKSLVYVAIPGAVFSLAFLAILYAKPLGITTLVPWTILGAALLISIGLSMIFRPLLARHRPWLRHHQYYRGYQWQADKNIKFDGNVDPDIRTVNDSDVDMYVKMGSSIRYVKSDDFHEVNIDVSMGDAKAYFENVQIKDSAIINVHSSLGGIELYIPKNWNVVKEIDNNLGGVTEEGYPEITDDSPIVTIRGSVSLSGLKITYI